MTKQPRLLAPIRVFSITFAFALLGAGAASVGARADDPQGGSSRNMRLVGTNDLQSRSTYQPTLHKYSSNRYILFAGHHALALQGEGLFPGAVTLPSFNPLTGKNEENGTSIVARSTSSTSRCRTDRAAGLRWSAYATAVHCRFTITRSTCCALTRILPTRSGR